MIRKGQSIISFTVMIMFLAVTGCASVPTGPSVMVLPGQGKSFEQFQMEDAYCRQWASQQIGTSPSQASTNSTLTGAGIGTLVGAGLGAAIGAAAGHAGTGAAIGAGSGLLVGTAAGANAGQLSSEEMQRRYDNTYIQCMYAKGNMVPGVVTPTPAPRERRMPPPPPPPPGYNYAPPDYYPAPPQPPAR